MSESPAAPWSRPTSGPLQDCHASLGGTWGVTECNCSVWEKSGFWSPVWGSASWLLGLSLLSLTQCSWFPAVTAGPFGDLLEFSQQKEAQVEVKHREGAQPLDPGPGLSHAPQVLEAEETHPEQRSRSGAHLRRGDGSQRPGLGASAAQRRDGGTHHGHTLWGSRYRQGYVLGLGCRTGLN